MKTLFTFLVLASAVYAEYCDHTSDCTLVDCKKGFNLSCYRDNVCTCVADYNTFPCTLGTECAHAFGRCTHGDHTWHCIDSKCHCRSQNN